MEANQTAVQTLFEVFKDMSKNMRNAGDKTFANILDYLCKEYEDKALAMEKEQIVKAVYDGMGTNFDPNMGRAEQYYNETYGK